MTMSTKKNRRSYTTRAAKSGSVDERSLRTSPMPPPLRRPWFMDVTMHMSSESHTRSAVSSTSSTKSSRRKR